jgi:DNA-directed RNA polymerase subunit RPC12/RpoP
MASRDYLCDECSHRFRTPPSDERDSPFVMCPACGSGFVTLDVDRHPGPVVMRATGSPKAGDWWTRVHSGQAS